MTSPCRTHRGDGAQLHCWGTRSTGGLRRSQPNGHIQTSLGSGIQGRSLRWGETLEPSLRCVKEGKRGWWSERVGTVGTVTGGGECTWGEAAKEDSGKGSSWRTSCVCPGVRTLPRAPKTGGTQWIPLLNRRLALNSEGCKAREWQSQIFCSEILYWMVRRGCAEVSRSGDQGAWCCHSQERRPTAL